MWSLASDFFSGSSLPRESRFEREYACYPVSFAGREALETGNKILLPQSALNTLARMNVTWPMLFQVSNSALSRETHSGVLEFSADEGTCYMPYWMMKNLLIREGDLVKIVNTSLPKGTYVKLQPVTTDFLDISDHRAVLEHSLRHFATLSVGDTIVIHHNNKSYEIEILECRPGKAISIIETDVQVDFALPKDYIVPQRILPSQQQLISESSSSICQSSVEESNTAFKLYGGTGSRLDGRPVNKTPIPSAIASLTREDVGKINQNSSSSEFDCPNLDVDNGSGRDDESTIEPWNTKLRLPGGVRTSCAEYSRLIQEGRLPGVVGKAKAPSPRLDRPIESSTSSKPFVLFGGRGRHAI